MSRQNKVNPGMYTQRGRLTQDDAARELRKQREIGSQHTWQPVKKDQLPRFESENDESDEGTETSEGTNGEQARPTANKAQPTRRPTKKTEASPRGKMKAAPPKAAKSSTPRKTAAKAKTGKAKTGKAKTAKAKTAKAKTGRAQTGRGGLSTKPRKTAGRRKS